MFYLELPECYPPRAKLLTTLAGLIESSIRSDDGDRIYPRVIHAPHGEPHSFLILVSNQGDRQAWEEYVTSPDFPVSRFLQGILDDANDALFRLAE